MMNQLSVESSASCLNESTSAAVLTFVVSDNMLGELAQIDPAPAIQSQRFGLRLIDIMAKVFPNVFAVSFLPIQDYPIGKKIFFRRFKFSYRGTFCLGLPFINIVILKHVSRFLVLLLNIRRLLAAHFVLVHGLHLPYIAFAVLLKYFGVRIGIALTDQQGVVLPTDGRLRAQLKNVDRWIAVKLANQFDFSIALSEALRETYASHSPSIVVPGVFDDELALRVQAVEPFPSTKFRVLYFGGLHADYGIRDLIEATSLLDENIEIRLFGAGPMVHEIGNTTLRNRNLYWGGLVDQTILVEEMANCDLLINPRPSNSTMAAYSSPSKLIEYAASGKAVLTTRLPSLPDTIADAALLIEQENAEGIAYAIRQAANMAPLALASVGKTYQKAVHDICSVDAIAGKLGEIVLKRVNVP